MEQLRYGVAELAKEEIKRAIEQHGNINSNHEAYALMKEELEEAEFSKLLLSQELCEFWEYVKKDEQIGTEDIYMKAIDLACEAIQVAAVAMKTEIFQEANK